MEEVEEERVGEGKAEEGVEEEKRVEEGKEEEWEEEEEERVEVKGMVEVEEKQNKNKKR